MRFSRRCGLRSGAAALGVALASAGVAGSAETEPDAAPAESRGALAAEIGAKAFDAVILRPFGAAATVGGFGCFLILGPMAAASLGIGTAWDILVLGPAEYTFVRPLGDF